MLGPRVLPTVREVAAAYALRHPCAQTSIELGRLGTDAVTVGAATLPLARFLDTGGERTVRLPGQADAGRAGEPPVPVRNRIARAVR
jgi:hypothetical protein